MKLGFWLIFYITSSIAPAAWAFKDFKPICGIASETLIAQKNFAENMLVLKAMDGSNQCWLVSFTLKDGAFDSVECRKLESCAFWRKNH